MLAADIENYTGNSDDKIRMLAGWLPEVLGEAFTRADLDFSTVIFPNQAGDGYVAGVDYHKLPRLINPLLGQLQNVLAERNAQANRNDPRMRLRVSVHIGPLPGENDAGKSDGNGTVMNEVHRLLNAEQARDALHGSDPDATFIAAIVSQRAYEDAVASEACALPASMFAPIKVHVKQFTGDAWLYVPQPSGPARHRTDTDSTNPRTARFPDSITSPERSHSVTPSSVPTSVFHIANAGQVANSTGPVTIHQAIPDSGHRPKP
jgi:hypothetical protein